MLELIETLFFFFLLSLYPMYIIFSKRNPKLNSSLFSSSSEARAGDSSPSPSSSSDFSSDGFVPKGTYDVFLSFRGEDTRKGFVSHLYTALVDKGIHTFRDDERLERGRSVAPELLKAIDDSKIAIVIFSRNYANSSWCLDELVHIIENEDKIVIPVFYDVDPSDIRKQRNVVAKALAKHTTVDDEEMQRWKKALTKAANFSGIDVPKTANGVESECIKQIVTNVFHELNRAVPYVSKDLVGLEWRVNRILKMLRAEESETVRMIGILGMGGAGKTTLASVVYNKLSPAYDGSCFLQIDVGECSDNGLKHLQKTLLSELLKADVDISHVEEGMGMIKNRLQTKKVLIVLDNVNSQRQLDALAAEHSYFCHGSSVIITTRDKQFVNGLDGFYEVELLNKVEALQLFSWHAFRRNHPLDKFVELSSWVIEYVKGLPLALRVLGSHLRGLTEMEWSSEITKLKKIPHNEILSVLKISYDGLDGTNKDIFLDVACYFRGMEVKVVTKVLDTFESYFKIGISPLVRNSLVTINGHGILEMHDLVQEMGRDIARKEKQGSRLWEKEEIVDVLTGKRGCEAVETIKYVNYAAGNLRNGVLERMKRLRLLVMPLGMSCSRIPKYLSDELRWLEWDEYPGVSLPASFEGRKLVALIMRKSHIVAPITGKQRFEKLRIMNLSLSHRMKRTLDFSRVPYLEELVMFQCSNLVEVHSSFGVHKKLQIVDFSYCCNLKILPERLQMESLKILNLYDLKKLEKFPEIEGKNGMVSLEDLDLSCTGITQTPNFSKLPSLEKLKMSHCSNLVEVHSSFGFHKKLQNVNMRSCHKLAMIPKSMKMESLKSLNLSDCVKLDKFAEIKGNNGMVHLEDLDLSYTAITRTPDFSKLPCLKKLNLSYCSNLVEVHPSLGVHKKLECVDLSHCDKLAMFPKSLRMESLKRLNLNYCVKMEKFPEIEANNSMANLEWLNLSNCTGIRRLPDSIRHLTGLRTLNLFYCTGIIRGWEMEKVIKDQYSNIEDYIAQLLSSSPPIITTITSSLMSRSIYLLTLTVSLTRLCLSKCGLLCLVIPGNCLPFLEVLDLSGNPDMQQLVISKDCLYKSLRLLVLMDSMNWWWCDLDAVYEENYPSIKRYVHLKLNHMPPLLHTVVSNVGVYLLNPKLAPKFDSRDYANATTIEIFDWEALSGILHQRNTLLTIQMSSNVGSPIEIPKWFKIQINKPPCQVILQSPSNWYNSKFRGLAIICAAHMPERLVGSINIKYCCGEKTFELCNISSYNILLFHYVPRSSQYFQCCLSHHNETTDDSLQQQIPLLDVWFRVFGPMLIDVKWGIQMVYEDDDGPMADHYINSNEIKLIPLRDEEPSDELRFQGVSCDERIELTVPCVISRLSITSYT